MKTGILVSAVAALVLGATAGVAQQGQGAPGAMFLERFDADGNGAVTQAEIDAYRTARFAEADADGDGFLTQAEMATHAETMRAARMAERRTDNAGRMLERLDTDGDGRLSAQEAAESARMPLFSRLDTDGDGAINSAEVAQMQGRMGDRQARGQGRDHDRGHGRGHDRGHERGHDRGHGHGKGQGQERGERGMPWWLR